AYDVRDGRTREVLAEMRLSSYSLLEDGSALTYAQDVTEKTDYDVILGVDNEVKSIASRGGDPRTVIKSTKGLTLVWSRDGRTFAYSKEGKVFVGSIDGGEARQIAGPAADAKPGDKTEKKDAEKFTAVRLSPRGDWLVASDKKGLWLID